MISFSKLMKFAYRVAAQKSFEFEKVDKTAFGEIRTMIVESIISVKASGQMIVKELTGENETQVRSFYLQTII